MPGEHVTSATLRLHDRIFNAHSHYAAALRARSAGLRMVPRIDLESPAWGFATNLRPHVTRAEAAVVATAAGQLHERFSTLPRTCDGVRLLISECVIYRDDGMWP